MTCDNKPVQVPCTLQLLLLYFPLEPVAVGELLTQSEARLGLRGNLGPSLGRSPRLLPLSLPLSSALF